MLWSSAPRRSALCSTESIGSPVYQRMLKPCQTLSERLSLNENWIAISTGRIDQAT